MIIIGHPIGNVIGGGVVWAFVYTQSPYGVLGSVASGGAVRTQEPVAVTGGVNSGGLVRTQQPYAIFNDPAPAGLIFEDTFTEASNTLLINHTPDTGTGWSVYASQDGSNLYEGALQVVAASGRLYCTSGLTPNFARGVIDDAMNSNQEVEAKLYRNDDFHGVLARSEHEVIDWSGYALFHNGSTVYLYRRNNPGGFTLLDSVALSFTAGETLRLKCSGDVIEGYVDDTLRVSFTDSSEDKLTSGKAGLRLNEVDDVVFDDFKAWNL